MYRENESEANVKVFKCNYKAGILALLFGTLMAAEALVQPGQVSNGVEPWSTKSGISSSDMFSGHRSIAHSENAHDRNMQRIWIGSLFAMATATAFDAATSWGKQEGNGLLASPNGQFGARGLSLKAAMAAALIVPQVVLRRHRELRTRFAVGNFVEAGMFTAVSVHNIPVRQSQ